MASIYKEGLGYAARVRIKGKSAYKAGFKTKAAAQAWVREAETTLLGTHQQMKGFGPMGTTLAQAMRQHADDFLTTKKGAQPVVTRMNAYFSAVDMPTLKAVPTSATATESSKLTRYFDLIEQPSAGAALPRTFAKYRAERIEKRPHTAAIRARLAAMLIGRIAPHDINSLVTAMKKDGFTTSSINNELSVLSMVFKQAKAIWLWEPLTNPVDSIKRDTPDNRRDRVLGDYTGEEEALAAALSECKNPYVAPFVWLSIETAMRKSESLLTARWEDINWHRRILHLRDSKTGKRDVPLTLGAIALLECIPGREEGGAIFKTTADAVDSAWERACARAGIQNLRIHDLRHTAATRLCERLSGDIFALKQLTGHKTLQMLERYVKPRPERVLEKLDATEPPARGKARTSRNGVPQQPQQVAAVEERVIGTARIRLLKVA